MSDRGDMVISDPARLAAILRFKRIAVVGMSANPHRPSHYVAEYLLQHGYDITPVNPNETEVLGRKCYPSLLDVPEPLEIVDIFRNAAAVPPIVEQAVERGAKAIWMQLGVIHEEAARHAHEAGLAVVMDRCIMVDHRDLSHLRLI
jgi:predicted CoA-binding protein